MFRVRKFQMRRRGFRPQGETFTGENPNKGIDMTTPELKADDVRPVVEKKPTKKETVVSKVKRVVKKATKK